MSDKCPKCPKRPKRGADQADVRRQLAEAQAELTRLRAVVAEAPVAPRRRRQKEGTAVGVLRAALRPFAEWPCISQSCSDDTRLKMVTAHPWETATFTMRDFRQAAAAAKEAT